MTEIQKHLGDLSSQERGSGARFNGGKPPLELIPVRIIVESWDDGLSDSLRESGLALARFQEGGTEFDLHDAIRFIGNQWDECAHVFDYGRKKYAEWNWAKGMSWSAVIGCAARHWRAIALGHHLDDESGLSHRGHFLCNMVMLLTYWRTYREGDDRPVEWLASRLKDANAQPMPYCNCTTHCSVSNNLGCATGTVKCRGLVAISNLPLNIRPDHGG